MTLVSVILRAAAEFVLLLMFDTVQGCSPARIVAGVETQLDPLLNRD